MDLPNSGLRDSNFRYLVHNSIWTTYTYEANFRYLVHSSIWTTYDELMKHAVIHAEVESNNCTNPQIMPTTPMIRPKALLFSSC